MAKSITFKVLVESAFATAKRIIEKDQIEAQATFMIVMPGGDLQMHFPKWHSVAEKHAEIEALRRLFEADKVEAYVFISEGWATKLKAEKGKPVEWDGVSPSLSPDRLEVLNVIGVTRAGERRSIMAYIKKDAKGKRVVERDTEADGTPSAGLDGDFMRLFETGKVSVH